MNDNLSPFARSYHGVRMAETQEELANVSADFSIVAAEAAMRNISAELEAEIATAFRNQTIWPADVMLAVMVAFRFFPSAPQAPVIVQTPANQQDNIAQLTTLATIQPRIRNVLKKR